MVDEEDTKCGFGSWSPDWLQKFANPNVFFVIFCIVGVLNGTYFSYVAAILSTIEKRYSFYSTITGVILIADNIGPLVTSVFIGYYGGNANRPKWIAGGMMFTVLSYFISAFPYFFYGPAIHLISHNATLSSGNGTENQFCEKDTVENCESNAVTIPAVACFVIGSFLKGFGSTAFYSIGTPYLDDNVKKKHSPMYLGLLSVFRMFGPILGYLMASACLKYYEDPLIDPGFTREDPRWIGAWWIGFIIFGAILFVFALLMLLFPHSLKKNGVKKIAEKTEVPSLKGMVAAIRRLVRNPFLICLFFAAAFRYSSMFGYYITVPRYVESQYRKPASEATLVSGPTAIIAAQIGILVGSIVVHRLTPSAKYLTGYMVFVEFISFAAFLSSLGLGCTGLDMPGTTFDGDTLFLENDCNADCGCTTKVFQPVCVPGGKATYFSPCHAGCIGKNESIYTDCSCLEGTEVTSVIAGYCPDECNMLVPFLAVLGTGKFMAATTSVIHILMLLRCVRVEDKSVVMGALEAFLSVFSFIPYPLAFGAIVDATCSVWEETCGKTGNCWIYDNTKFRYYVHITSAVLVFISGIFDVGMFLLSGTLKNVYDEEEKIKVKTALSANSECDSGDELQSRDRITAL